VCIYSVYTRTHIYCIQYIQYTYIQYIHIQSLKARKLGSSLIFFFKKKKVINIYCILYIYFYIFALFRPWRNMMVIGIEISLSTSPLSPLVRFSKRILGKKKRDLQNSKLVFISYSSSPSPNFKFLYQASQARVSPFFSLFPLSHNMETNSMPRCTEPSVCESKT
jgi:hypothetical protein